MKNTNLIRIAAVSLLAWVGSAQAQTVNLINNLGASDGSTIFGSSGSGLSNGTKYLLGTFGARSHADISALFGASASGNQNAIYSNFSILASLTDADGGGFAQAISNQADGDVAGFSFTGNIAATFNAKPMQLIVIDGTSHEFGIFSAWDYNDNSAVSYLAGDIADVNNFALMTSGALAGYDIQIGAQAIYGTSAGNEFRLSSATAIPEPASGSLFLIGAAGVLALRRLRKSNV